MRHTVTALALALATVATAQSSHFNVPGGRIQHTTFFQSYAPNTEVSGVTILRSQKDWNAFWAALHGTSYVKNSVAPRQYDFKKQQLIAIVLPRRIRFDAIPRVDCITRGRQGVWQIDLSPIKGSGFNGASRLNPYVIIRTPRGSDDLDIVLHGSHGDTVLSTRSRPRHDRRRKGIH